MHHLAIQIICLHISELEFSKLHISYINVISLELILHQNVKQGLKNAILCSNIIYNKVATCTRTSDQLIKYTL